MEPGKLHVLHRGVGGSRQRGTHGEAGCPEKWAPSSCWVGVSFSDVAHRTATQGAGIQCGTPDLSRNETQRLEEGLSTWRGEAGRAGGSVVVGWRAPGGRSCFGGACGGSPTGRRVPLPSPLSQTRAGRSGPRRQGRSNVSGSPPPPPAAATGRWGRKASPEVSALGASGPLL